MTIAPLPGYEYQVGGSLPVDAQTYVIREADENFYTSLKAGEFCYVLNSRQMGKSSLRVQVMQRLQMEGFACAAIDITAIGTADITPEQWYAGVIDSLVGSLNIYNNFDLEIWWNENHLISPVQKFSKFLETILLKIINQKIVIFIDEIDSILSLAFNLDDFFAVIRDCYNRRADNIDYHRLTFALIGVSTPSDLIQDKRRTPFNIGRAIDLTGFQLQEAEPLARGLAKVGNAQELMAEILDWTGGQPFLTQKVCKLVIQESGKRVEIEDLVRKRIIENWEGQDEPEHLKTIRDRILRSGEKRTGRLLGLCQQILQNQEITTDESSEQIELRLTGLVVKRDGKLQIYNRIYGEVFNLEWCNGILAKLRPYADGLNAWIDSGKLDESQLLRGQTLRDAQKWTEGKSLNDLDYQFLAASQELEKQDIQKRLEVEEQAKLVLVEANYKANQRIKFGSVVLILSLSVAITLSIFSYRSLEISKSAILEAEKVEKEANLAKIDLKKSQVETAELHQQNEQILQKANAAVIRQKKAEISEQKANQKSNIAKINLAKASQLVNQKNQELQNISVAATNERDNARQQIENARIKAEETQQKLISAKEKLQMEIQVITQNVKKAESQVNKTQQEQKVVQSQLEKSKQELIQKITDLDTLNSQLNQVQSQLDEIQKDMAESYSTALEGIEQQTGQKPAVVYVNFIRTGQNESDDDKLDIWLVTAKGQLQIIKPTVTRTKVLKVAKKFRRVMRMTAFSQEQLQYSQQIYQWIITPLEKHLRAQKINNLVFILDDYLRYIPLASLYDGHKFLVEKYSIGLMPGLILNDTRYVNIKNSKILAMGASSFRPDQPQFAEDLFPLDLDSILTLSNGKIFWDDKFTLENLNKQHQDGNFSIVHLHTYLHFDKNLSNSYIQFWNSKLPLNQIKKLNLYNPSVELLILISSETGVGFNEELKFGFASAGLQTGARSVLATLWKNDARASTVLMKEFYKQLRIAPTKSEALRRAQLSLMRKDEFQNPYFWATFTMIGNPW